MIYLQAPDRIETKLRSTSVFLAGGISNCPQWQSYVKDSLVDIGNELTLINPRQQDYLFDDAVAARHQIGWEYEYLHRVDTIAFWFPKETVCPISLFELGCAVTRSKNESLRVFVGCHPEYSRKFDLEVQLGIRNTYIEIVNSLDELSHQIRKRVTTSNMIKELCKELKRNQ